MSIPVELDRLAEETERYGASAYLLTAGDDGRPHAVAAAVRWDGERLLATAGHRTRVNAGRQPLVSLLWPPPEAGGYSLIVDGTAEAGDSPAGPVVWVTPTRGVLHRPGPAAAPERAGCTSDCVPLLEP